MTGDTSESGKRVKASSFAKLTSLMTVVGAA